MRPCDASSPHPILPSPGLPSNQPTWKNTVLPNTVNPARVCTRKPRARARMSSAMIRACRLRQMTQFIGMLFPVPAIKVLFDYPHSRRQFKATQVDAEAIGIGARYVVRFDAASGTKQVLRRATVEAVFPQILLAPEQTKMRCGNDEMHKSEHAAYRAVAMLDDNLLVDHHFECNAATMTAPVSPHIAPVG